MDKIYYTSNGQVYSSDGELYHWGWKKKDAKYISRERKNGKWVYTYPNENVGGSTGSGKSEPDPVKKTDTKSSKSSAIRIGSKTIPISKKTEKIIDKINDFAADRKKDWEESKERGTKKAEAEATKDDGKIIADKDGIRKREKTSFADSEKNWSTTTTTIRTADNEEYRYINRGKLDQYIDTAKEYIKDRLGYDEREALDVADAKYKYAQRAEKNYVTEATVSKAFMGTVNPRTGEITYTDKQKKEIEEMNRREKMLRDKTTQAGNEASDAAKAYFNTPIGKLERATNRAEDWLEELFGKKR